MAKEPGRRYATASELAADLRRFLRGEPILARPAGWIERAWRWCRNNRRVAALLAVVGILLFALAVGGAVSFVLVSRERTEALVQARQAETQRGLALDAFSSLIGGIQDQLGTQPGTLELRRSLLETAREGLRKVARSGDPRADAAADQGTVVAWKKLGDVDLALGRTADADKEFTRAAAIAERLAKVDPRSVPIRRELASAYDRLGDQLVRTYDPKNSSESYQKAHAIRLALARERPGDAKVLRDVRVSLGKLADVRQRSGDIAGAKAIYESVLARMKAEPAAVGTDQALFRSDLRFVYGRLGLLAQAEYDGPGALAAYRESLAQAEALLAAEPANRSWRREHSVSLELLGAASLAFRDWPAAEKAFRTLLAARRQDADADPSDLAARRTLALAHQHLGDLFARRREFDESRAAYIEAVKILDDLAARDPQSVTAHKDRLIVRRKLAESEAEAGRFEDAARWADGEFEALAAKGAPPHTDRDAWLAEARFVRDVFRAVPRAIADPGFARRQHPPLAAATLLKIRAIALARRGDREAASRAAAEVLAMKDDPSAALLSARVYALAARCAPPDLKAAYIKSALDALRAALRADPSLARRLAYEPDLDALRDDAGYQSLVQPAASSH
jgi:tetratricopeptide (TPR) repeat protein